MIIDRINSSIEERKQFISIKNLIFRDVQAFKTACELKMFCIGETDTVGGKMNNLSAIKLYNPSNNKPIIQLVAIAIEIIICEIVRQLLFNNV